MAEEAILEGSDPASCVYLPAKNLIAMPGWWARDPAPCALHSFLHPQCQGTEQPLLFQGTEPTTLCAYLGQGRAHLFTAGEEENQADAGPTLTGCLTCVSSHIPERCP